MEDFLMRQKIDQEISVIMYYSAQKKLALPRIIYWQNEEHVVGEIGYKHQVKNGQTTYHIYEFTNKENTLSFRISLNGSNLHWKLEYISDGLAD